MEFQWGINLNKPNYEAINDPSGEYSKCKIIVAIGQYCKINERKENLKTNNRQYVIPTKKVPLQFEDWSDKNAMKY